MEKLQHVVCLTHWIYSVMDVYNGGIQIVPLHCFLPIALLMQ